MAQTPDDFAAQTKAAVETMTPPLARICIAFEAAGDISAEVASAVTEIMEYARSTGLDDDLLVVGALRRIQSDIELIRLLRAEAAKS